MYLIGFLLLLGPLVTVHEFGHYLVGRFFGVKADAFSVGFGKELAGYTDKRGTRWKLSALPLGGYVQFKGDMNPASMPDQSATTASADEVFDGSFHKADLWKRALIVFAGPATNIIVAIAIYAAFAMAIGKPVIAPVVGGFSEQSVARDAGLRVGDRITDLNGEPIDDFYEIVDEVLPYPGRELVLTVNRDGGILTIPITAASVVRADRFGNEGRVGQIGISPSDGEFVKLGPLQAVNYAASECWKTTVMMVNGLGQILSGERSVKELGGPIKIAKYSGEQLSLGILPFIGFAALISINLAFINLLPIPALDGGHLAFYAAEAIRRKPVGPRGQEMAFRVGMALVLGLMVFVTANDIISLPIFGS
jgi:regulator of sigma E protease